MNDYLIKLQKRYKDGDIESLGELGMHYRMEGNYNEMMKYLQEGIDKKDADCMLELGFYYQQNKDYDKMKYYYEMAFEHGHCGGMQNLGCFYINKQDYENAMKCCDRAINYKINDDYTIDLIKDIIIPNIIHDCINNNYNKSTEKYFNILINECDDKDIKQWALKNITSYYLKFPFINKEFVINGLTFFYTRKLKEEWSQFYNEKYLPFKIKSFEN